MGGAVVAWHSKLLQVTTWSSNEYEYCVVGEAAMEFNWMWNLLNELGWNSQEPMTLHCDSHVDSLGSHPEYDRLQVRSPC